MLTENIVQAHCKLFWHLKVFSLAKSLWKSHDFVCNTQTHPHIYSVLWIMMKFYLSYIHLMSMLLIFRKHTYDTLNYDYMDICVCGCIIFRSQTHTYTHSSHQIWWSLMFLNNFSDALDKLNSMCKRDTLSNSILR